jgi:carboxypeptidase Q
MKHLLLFVFLLIGFCSTAQSNDEVAIRKIYDEALANGHSYKNLEYLATKIGARLSGSAGAAKAVEWSKKVMEDYGFDSVWLQPVMVPHWVRGAKEVANIQGSATKSKPVNVNVCALGGSVGTGQKGILANVIEVKTLDELAKLGESGIKGKIVFFNRPMDPKLIHTFAAYGGAGDQRRAGPSEAAKYGALGVVVRSLASNVDEFPHTGSTSYKEGIAKIPAFAIATLHADWLSKALKEDATLKLFLQSNCETLPDAPSFNVVGQIKGSEFPKEIIDVGGHLDSWDLAQGAHDDGTGCVQSIEVLRVFKAMGYKPKRTIRAVMFMNEENGLRGGLKYAELAKTNNENHIAAIESDAGGFTPRGFSMGGKTKPMVKTFIQSWKPLLEPYGLTDIGRQGGGADIGPLEPLGTVVIGFVPDSQRYFDYHHTPIDTFDKVSKRELDMGAASMTALVYLIDQYGLK